MGDFKEKTIDFKTCLFMWTKNHLEKKNISIFGKEIFIAKETCLIETISLFDIVSILFTKELWGYLCWKDLWKIYREM